MNENIEFWNGGSVNHDSILVRTPEVDAILSSSVVSRRTLKVSRVAHMGSHHDNWDWGP